jgi:hypothetical protein
MRVKDLRRGSAWVDLHARDALSWDLYLGFAAFAVSAALAAASPAVRGNALTVLIAESALSVALLGAVLTALAVLVTFFDDYYRQVLSQASERGVAGAIAPYQIVAFVSAWGAAIGFIVALAWPVLPATLQAVGLGLTTGLVVWASFGVVQLVNMTVFHGGQRARLLEAVDHVRAQSRRRSA